MFIMDSILSQTISADPLIPYSFEIHFSIILSCTLKYHKWSLPFRVFY